MKNKPELYFSCDIESNGPIPANNSMLSLGSAVFTKEGKMLDTFYINFKTLPNATPDPGTMEWWSKNQEAYNATQQNTVDPKLGIGQFVNWVNKTCGDTYLPVFVGYPLLFDMMFVYYYMIHFGYQSPFSFSGLDLKSYAMAMLKLGYRDSTKKNMPKRWFSDKKHTHNALDDAIEQGELFINMLHENMK